MYDKDLIRVHTHPHEAGAWFATVTTISGGRVMRLYTTLVHLDLKSLLGWLKDFKAALRDAMCIWCGDPLNYVTEIDELDIFGFCSTDCQAEALKEAHDENLVR